MWTTPRLGPTTIGRRMIFTFVFFFFLLWWQPFVLGCPWHGSSTTSALSEIRTKNVNPEYLDKIIFSQGWEQLEVIYLDGLRISCVEPISRNVKFRDFVLIYVNIFLFFPFWKCYLLFVEHYVLKNVKIFSCKSCKKSFLSHTVCEIPNFFTKPEPHKGWGVVVARHALLYCLRLLYF